MSNFFAFLEAHQGLVCWALVGLVLLVLYLRGQAQGFWPFLAQTLSEWDPATQRWNPSTKRMTLMLALWSSLWAFTKLTLAVCRWIDKDNDPTAIYLTVALAVLGLAGGTYLGGKWLAGKLPPGFGPSPTDTKAE